MSFFKLDNVIKNYAWGCKNSFNKMFKIPNLYKQHQAEIWMGAHPAGCSRSADNGELLSEIIYDDKVGTLGRMVADKYGELPFLFKVLAADTPLSIQVHPNKQNSEIGFARENAQGIPLDAPNRNYKDPNHKPELIYALTPYKAMNGFRPIKQIIDLFDELDIYELKANVETLRSSPNATGLKYFFESIMKLDGVNKEKALKALEGIDTDQISSAIALEALSYCAEFAKHYPNDVGLFAPFILNTIELRPGEAMFLYAGTPHAYVKGTALEVMANSDNVLRAGLTPKYIDVDELIKNLVFDSVELMDLKIKPLIYCNRLLYQLPIDDFSFEMITLNDQDIELCEITPVSAEVLFCVKGSLVVKRNEASIVLKMGESAFVCHKTGRYSVSGSAEFARVYTIPK